VRSWRRFARTGTTPRSRPPTAPGGSPGTRTARAPSWGPACAAILGACLGALRELYNDPCAHLSFDGERWHVLARIDLQADPVFDGVGSGDDEFNALQAAWDAHPSLALTPAVGSP